MNSGLPKCCSLWPGGRPAATVIDTARVCAHQYLRDLRTWRREVQAALGSDDVEWILQRDQWGTGHGALQACASFPTNTVLVRVRHRAADPARHSDQNWSRQRRRGRCECASQCIRRRNGLRARRPDAAGMSAPSSSKRMRGPEQWQYAKSFRTHGGSGGRLREWRWDWEGQRPARVLHDRCGGGRRAGRATPCEAKRLHQAAEVMGVNDKIQLEQVEALYRARAAAELLLEGRGRWDRREFDIRGDVTAGRDRVHRRQTRC